MKTPTLCCHLARFKRNNPSVRFKQMGKNGCGFLTTSSQNITGVNLKKKVSELLFSCFIRTQSKQTLTKRMNNEKKKQLQ